MQKTRTPIDCGWAWVIAFSAFVQNIAILMVVRATALLFVEFIDMFDASTGSTAFIPGLSSLLQFGLSPVSNILSHHFGARRVVMLGGVLSSIGCLLSAYARSVVHLYLSYGVLIGTGFGLMYSPTLVLLGQYFDRRRALANGLAGAGSALSAILSPLLVRHLLDNYGYQATLIFYAGIQVHVCASGALLRPLSFYNGMKSKKHARCSNNRKSVKLNDSNENYLNVVCEGKQSVSCHELRSSQSVHPNKLSAERECYSGLLIDATTGAKQRADTASHLALTSSLAVSTGDFFATSLQKCNFDENPTSAQSKSKQNDSLSKVCLFKWSTLRNRVFILLLLADFFSILGFPVVPMFLGAYCKDVGISSASAALVLSLSGITELLIRPFVSWLTDLNLVPKIYFKIFNCFALGVCCIVFSQLKTFTDVLLITLIVLPLVGLQFTLIPVVVADLLGIQSLPSTLGVNMLVVACGFFVSPIIAGNLHDVTGQWLWTFTLCGLFCVLSGALLIAVHLCRKVEFKKSLEDQHDGSSYNI